MFYISVLIVSIYFLTLIYFLTGLLKINISQNIITDYSNGVSVILCVKNGESSINNILQDLKKQNYQGEIEFLVVDDNSSDRTKDLIFNFVNLDSRFKYFNSNQIKDSEFSYKKKALNVGIKNAKFDSLLFTDVDCRVKPNWVKSMTADLRNHDYIIGYSSVIPDNSLVSQFQSIDFKMLMFSAAGTTLLGLPLACSGQNQSYKKSLFLKVGGFRSIKNLLQGDDSIFLQICRYKQKIKTKFSLDKNSFVESKTHNSFWNFIMQRMRWAGDANIMWKYNKLFFIIIISTFYINFLILFLFISQKYLFELLILLLIKFIFEFSIYFVGSNRISGEINFASFIFWFCLQPLYVFFLGLLSFFAFRINWRGLN